MGVGIEHIGERRRRAALRRAIWRNIEATLPGEFDYEAANEVVKQLCGIVLTVAEDMKSVGEFNRIGYRKRHWYAMELHISEDSMTAQNTLEGAFCEPRLPPTHFGTALGWQHAQWTTVQRI